MFGMKQKLKTKIEKIAMEFALSFFNEHIKGGKLAITPDFENQGIYIKFDRK